MRKLTSYLLNRIHVKDEYGDIPLGVFVVRGENVVLLGEIEETEEVKGKLKQVTLKEILEKQAVQQAEKEETERLRYNIIKNGLNVKYYNVKSIFFSPARNGLKNVPNIIPLFYLIRNLFSYILIKLNPD